MSKINERDIKDCEGNFNCPCAADENSYVDCRQLCGLGADEDSYEEEREEADDYGYCYSEE